MASKHRLDLLVVDGYNVIFKSERYMARMDRSGVSAPVEQARALVLAGGAADAQAQAINGYYQWGAAGLAQWQSNGFVNRGWGVRLPLPAPETFLAPERFLWGRFCARARIGRQVHAL